MLYGRKDCAGLAGLGTIPESTLGVEKKVAVAVSPKTECVQKAMILDTKNRVTVRLA